MDISSKARAKKRYHHGDLAAALLSAAVNELAEKGMEAFSLRGVAKRAGVSHAAPAHHFTDVQGLLTALAALGFDKLVRRQSDFKRQAAKDARSQLVAIAVGYVYFAMENPSLFRLMFGSSRTDFANPNLGQMAGRAYEELVNHVVASMRTMTRSANADERCHGAALDKEVAAIWAVTHGLADLLLSGRMKSIEQLPAQAKQASISDILQCICPA